MKIILAYSAKNNNANNPPPYSILNPDTNSDSPSAKSKGARLVSANELENHTNILGKNNKITGKAFIAISKLVSNIINTGNKITNNNLTSYEIVCAEARTAPKKAYLEFEDQPANKIEYTFNAETQKKIINPKFKYFKEKFLGYKTHTNKDIENPNIGANQNKIWFLIIGEIFSFINNLTASEKGWRIPRTPTLLGPLRIWEYPRIFRSNKV